jgi:hypothetical protein
MVMLFSPIKRPERAARPTRPEAEAVPETAVMSEREGEG